MISSFAGAVQSAIGVGLIASDELTEPSQLPRRAPDWLEPFVADWPNAAQTRRGTRAEMERFRCAPRFSYLPAWVAPTANRSPSQSSAIGYRLFAKRRAYAYRLAERAQTRRGTRVEVERFRARRGFRTYRPFGKKQCAGPGSQSGNCAKMEKSALSRTAAAATLARPSSSVWGNP